MKPQDLLQLIKKYNEEYRLGRPSITDMEYDSLVAQLREADPDNEWFRSPEPSPVSASRKVTLPIPMKSLNKVKSYADLNKWIASLGLPPSAELVIMPKFDGISLLRDERTGMVYSRGGADNEGQDCSAHYREAGIITPDTDMPYTFGELLFSRFQWANFKEMICQTDPSYPCKSPRNTTAALVHRDTPSPYLQYLTFFRYGTDAETLKRYTSFHELISDICYTYNQPPLYIKVTAGGVNNDTLMALFKQWSARFPIDGLVVYINDLRLWETIGRNQTSGNPLYAIAYKHPEFTDTYETAVKSITWRVNKSGALKPVVNIDPVDTGDCNMENPTGYNAGWVSDHRIANGASVLVTRSGGVIPKILETISPAGISEIARMWDEVSVCPDCGEPTQWSDNLIELYCTNPECPGIKLAKIVFFYSVCGAENMGEELIRKIFNAGYTSVSAMLHITFKELMAIDGFAEGLSAIVTDNNRKILSGLEMPVLMHASDCFSGIGQVKARKLLYDMTESERDAFCRLEYCPPPVEESMSKTLQAFLLGIRPFYEFVRSTGIPVVRPASPSGNIHGPLSGTSVCMSGFRDKTLEGAIVGAGGKIAGGVTRNTSVLVVRDKDIVTSKTTNAKLIGIPIYTIEEFKSVYGLLSDN